ncbi:MAG: biotin--[Candidatus Aramenus sp.]|nr:biotin--[acetyl-CoA-carboxylase] ligase [Candidatus Aramenus sp.]
MLVIKLDKVTSTQDFAEAVYSLLYSEYVVVAEEQTKARGRYGREWYSPKGGLWFTYVKYNFPTGQVPMATLKSSLAIRQVLGKYVDARIRWPNDIVVNKKKISGVLVEAIAQGETSTIFIGPGVNTNVTAFPQGISATSLFLETGKEFNNDELLLELVKSIDEYLKIGDKEAIEEVNRYLSIKDEKVKIYGKDFAKECEALFVDNYGRLITDCGIFEVEDVLRLESS